MEETSAAIPSDGSSEHGLPSCDGCRQRKLKCSRDTPSCSKCQSLGVPCVYDMRKNKPGLKAGAIESLGKRIDALERLVSERDSPSEGFANSNGAASTSRDGQVPGISPTTLTTTAPARESDLLAPLHGCLATVAEVLSKLNDNINVLSQSMQTSPRPLPASQVHSLNFPDSNRPTKRVRLDTGSISGESPEDNHLHPSVPAQTADTTAETTTALLQGDTLDALLDAYFTKLHPWIPMIHQSSFRQRIRLAQHGSGLALGRLSVILDAMIAGALHLVDAARLPPPLSDEPTILSGHIQTARSRVVVEATSKLSVENLQALIIIAFTDLGSCEPSCAWPIIGCLTRAVEFLQLNVEDDQHHTAPMSFLSPPLLSPPKTWIEEEERRRVFWNIFALDRTCSITTGWNVGLTGDNVSRRLPVCGTHWNDDEMQAQAPFFEIWDKASAKISNSIAFLPAHYSSPGRASEGDSKGPGSGGAGNGVVTGSADLFNSTKSSDGGQVRMQRAQKISGPIDKSAVGAFSYYVESLEWLSRIFTYFLQPKVNYKDPQEVSSWLTRFKELDLDLVHWKMFLPPKWKDPSIPPPETANFLDPNMSLAHITHNTSMILLHQHIGYPNARQYALQRLQLRLPSDYSAETCQLAAIETANITREYLASAPGSMAVSPHFAFCAFVSAKLLLVHSQYYKTQLDPRFDILLACIRQISSRWQGTKGLTSSTLAEKFETELQWLRHRCQQDSNTRISVLGPLESTRLSNTTSANVSGAGSGSTPAQGTQDPFSPSYLNTGGSAIGYRIPNRELSAAVSTPSTGTGHRIQSPYCMQSNSAGGAVTTTMTGMSVNGQNQDQLMDGAAWIPHVNGHDGLSSILDALTDSSFVDLDRIISFDDTYPPMAGVSNELIVGVPETSDQGWNRGGYS